MSGTTFLSDSVTLVPGSVLASFTSKNVGTVPVTVTGYSFSSNDYIFTTPATLTANITPAPLSISGLTAVNKVYDGSTTASVTGVEPLGLSGTIYNGDDVRLTGTSVSNVSAVFSTRDAGTAVPVILTGGTLDGTSKGNYTLITNLVADITPLSSVTWIGGTSGNWSSAANWYGGALPDAQNVQSVVIPIGQTVTFDSNVRATTLQSLTGGNLTMTGSALTVNGASGFTGSITLGSLNQSGGTITGKSNLTVGSASPSGSFVQSAGSISITGDAAITNASGNLSFVNLSAKNASFYAPAGGITLGNIATTGTLGVTAAGTISLSNPVSVGGASILTTTGGNIVVNSNIAKSAGDAASLTLQANGWIYVNAGHTISDTESSPLSLSL